MIFISMIEKKLYFFSKLYLMRPEKLQNNAYHGEDFVLAGMKKILIGE